MTRTRIILSVGVVAATLGLAGCMGIHHGRPEGRGPRSVKAIERPDTAPPKHWQQIYLGSPPRPVHAGYLRTVTRRGKNEGGHWVFDTNFKLIGRITPKGQTFRIDHRAGETSLGGFALHNAIRRLHERSQRTEVSLTPMPAPRG